MRAKSVLATCALLLSAGIFVRAAVTEVALVEASNRSDRVGQPSAPAPIVFVCRNGVAMSVWSAAYFNRLAAARGLPERAVARAAIPSYTEIPFRMVLALAIDGFRVSGFRPRVVGREDARSAALVVAIDTDLPPEARADASRLEVWDGFPPMREQYFRSRRALGIRVEALVDRLAADG